MSFQPFIYQHKHLVLLFLYSTVCHHFAYPHSKISIGWIFLKLYSHLDHSSEDHADCYHITKFQQSKRDAILYT